VLERNLIVFDMDGTLIDSAKDITNAINRVRSINHQLPPLQSDLVVDIINRDKRNLAKLFYNTECYEAQDRELFEKIYEVECVKNVYLYEGVKEMLEQLSSAGYYLGVATNAPTKFAKIMLEHLNVAKLFDNIFGVESPEDSKPNPTMLLKHETLAGAVNQKFMIGDNSKDMAAAKNANFVDIFATWGFSRVGSATYVLQHPQEVLPIVISS